MRRDLTKGDCPPSQLDDLVRLPGFLSDASWGGGGNADRRPKPRWVTPPPPQGTTRFEPLPLNLLVVLLPRSGSNSRRIPPGPGRHCRRPWGRRRPFQLLQTVRPQVDGPYASKCRMPWGPQRAVESTRVVASPQAYRCSLSGRMLGTRVVPGRMKAMGTLRVAGSCRDEVSKGQWETAGAAGHVVIEYQGRQASGSSRDVFKGARLAGHPWSRTPQLPPKATRTSPQC